ncbi:ParB/RepB/Spo0J family partition protein [Aeoliella sp. SH292]|uniref:ParB/RepB/Spo0J family partition protein n=1 Tax=Aeoliella sp. SH292 TaxID=3454464 RepID=UPI003F997785
MTTLVKLACQPEIQAIPVASILPMRKVSDGVRTSTKYRRIAASIQEIGVIEPLIVHPVPDTPGQFMLLDGHLRLDVLKFAGAATADCLISDDDEAFTYNHKVNQLSAMQEHFMIHKALKNGVSEEDVARTLCIEVSKVRLKRDLLEGICPEAVELLKDKRVTREGLQQLRQVAPMRQIEMAELMCASHNFSSQYTKCLLAATPQDQLRVTDADPGQALRAPQRGGPHPVDDQGEGSVQGHRQGQRRPER